MTLFEAPEYVPRPPRRPRRAASTVFIVVGAVSLLAGAAFAASFLQGSPAPPAAAPPSLPAPPAPAEPTQAAPEPSAEAVELADRMPLTDEGRELFLSAEPEIVDGDGIRELCERGHRSADETATSVLGCYRSGHRIAVFRAADPRLHDTTIITAAHELLHAAYARMEHAERELVNRLIGEETARVPADDPVHAQIEASVDGNPEALANEQFAYLGTQIRLDGGFDAALERIYARYFSDRDALVDTHHRAMAVIPQVRDAVQAQWDELGALEQANANLEAQLAADRASHESALAAYNADAAEFNALPAEERGAYVSTVTYPDGRTEQMSWEAALQLRHAELESFRAGIEERTAQLEADRARAAQLRAEAEAAHADLEALIQASSPA